MVFIVIGFGIKPNKTQCIYLYLVNIPLLTMIDLLTGLRSKALQSMKWDRIVAICVVHIGPKGVSKGASIGMAKGLYHMLFMADMVRLHIIYRQPVQCPCPMI